MILPSQYLLLFSSIIALLSGFNTIVFAEANENNRSKEEMVFIPAGEFLLGSTGKEGRLGYSIGVDEVPQRTVHLKAYYIDKYEVTNDRYRMFIEATDHPSPVDVKHGLYSWNGNTPPDGQENFPVTYVSWHEADEFCQWAGKRLPSEEEWEKAARGVDGRQWPWGNDYKGSVCNTKYGSGPQSIIPVGSTPEDRSPYGVYDMCGNVSEWTSSWYLPYPGSSLIRESFGEKYKVTRGGSWVIPAIPYSRSPYRANTFTTDYQHRGIGFRCVKDVDEK